MGRDVTMPGPSPGVKGGRIRFYLHFSFFLMIYGFNHFRYRLMIRVTKYFIDLNLASLFGLQLAVCSCVFFSQKQISWLLSELSPAFRKCFRTSISVFFYFVIFNWLLDMKVSTKKVGHARYLLILTFCYVLLFFHLYIDIAEALQLICSRLTFKSINMIPFFRNVFQ